MIEIDSYKMRDGNTLTLTQWDHHKWAVSCYNRADIEEWTMEFGELAEASKTFGRLKQEDKES